MLLLVAPNGPILLTSYFNNTNPAVPETNEFCCLFHSGPMLYLLMSAGGVSGVMVADYLQLAAARVYVLAGKKSYKHEAWIDQICILALPFHY